ncbi:CotY/CotZ family spore coat protein [Ornithinibacillus halotolerans]|uniref:Spore coat protein Y n=1 Tax=Ornithinibacillus halotolerans TaxID=1274357 RepID=A0A916WCC2_9BACI|nr:CotY/CotZ family spore coat protein [Ornithinibacillus halotolerans]GGA84946.1 spore coat protein Y [Ornithinibacillus halotolerans]
MSCCSGKHSGHCVCDMVRKIVLAQNEAEENQNNCCTTGCEQSIEKLLSPTTVTDNGPTTIPFLLYCKGDCDLFFARGVRMNENTTTTFDCVETPIFKAKKFKHDCCVELELLEVTSSGSQTIIPSPNHPQLECGFLPSSANGLRETGICITVDLHCFCAIQCLDPTTPANSV